MIVDLALFFARHVFWPRGLAETVEWPAALLAAGALLTLMRFKIGVVPVIGACALAGLGWRWFSG